MTLETHADRKYQATTQLLGFVETKTLRVEHRLVGPGSQQPGTCRTNEIVFALSGRSFTLRAANGITQRNFVQAGMACICPVGTFESASGTASPLECLHVYVPPHLIERSATADYDIDPAKAELVYAGGLTDGILYELASGFRSGLGRDAEPLHRLFLDGLQAALAGYLLGRYSIRRWQPPARAPDLDARRLQRVLDLIEATYLENISLIELAAEACLSEFHFSRLFKEATGLSPYRYVTWRRVQEAQKRLELSQSSLVEIALDTGFGSQANFNRTFRRLTGTTPGEYRALRQ